MITASIVVHKTPPHQLYKVLTCLVNSAILKIWVIDNSGNYDLEKVALTFPKVEYHNVENKGYGAGHNVAIKKSIIENSRYHLVINADVYWIGDVITPIKDFMDGNPDIGILAPKTFYPNGKMQFICRMLPTPLDLFFKRFLSGKITKKRVSKYLLEDLNHNKDINCPYLLGSFMFFRTEALKTEGLFDEKFFMYPEDIDITRRIHRNYRTLYWPGVSIVHEHQQASRKNLKMFWIHFSNMIKYFNKWGWFFDKERKKFNNTLRKNSYIN